MTDWKSRALAAEQKLADAKRELETFYNTHLNGDIAIAAMRRLKVVLGVEVSRYRDAPPESVVVEVSYQLEQRERW